MNPTLPRIAALLLSAGCLLPAYAADPPSEIEQVRATTMKLINLLVEQGLLTREKADALLKEASAPSAPRTAEAAAPAPAAAASGAAPAVRVPYVPEFVRKEMKEEIRAELAAQAEREGWAGPGAVPDWARHMTWEGDMRTRYEFDKLPSSNGPAVNINATNSSGTLALLNTTQNQHNELIRARLGMTDIVDENWSTGIRLVTGSTQPVTSNQTLGDYGLHYMILLDRAYIRFTAGDQFSAVAGRFGNPWFGTDLVWANDISFDGLAAQWTPRLSPVSHGFLTLAALPVQSNNFPADNKWLFGAQAGLDQGNLPGGISGKFGLAWYDYVNITGRTSPAGSTIDAYTAPGFSQKGNTYYDISSNPNTELLGLAAHYRLLDLTAALDVPAPAGKHVILNGDFVRNLGFNATQVSALVGSPVTAQNTGFMLRATVGDTEVAKRGAWQVWGGYKRVEADAVLDAFTDADFHLGGTNAKGFVVGASYGLGHNVAASLRVFNADAISGPPLAIDVWQLDLNVRF